MKLARSVVDLLTHRKLPLQATQVSLLEQWRDGAME